MNHVKIPESVTAVTVRCYSQVRGKRAEVGWHRR